MKKNLLLLLMLCIAMIAGAVNSVIMNIKDDKISFNFL